MSGPAGYFVKRDGLQVAVCADCFEGDGCVMVVEDARHWGDDDVENPDCYECGSVIE